MAPALRGVGFAEGEAMLAPGAGDDGSAAAGLVQRRVRVQAGASSGPGVVQRESTPGAPAPDHAHAADPDVEAAVLDAPGTTERPGPAYEPTVLTPEQLASANRANRRLDALDPHWVGQLQRWLGVSVTGHVGEETMDILAGKYPLSNGVLDRKTRAAIVAEAKQEIAVPTDPARTGIAEQLLTGAKFEVAPDQLQAPVEKAKASHGKEVAAVEAATHAPWAAWTGQFQTIDFLGFPVTGNPAFVTRLAAAQAYLAGRTKEPDPALMREKLGVADPRTVGCMMGPASNYNLRIAGGSFHTVGMAIDINKPSNPWVATETGGGRAARGNAIFVEVSGRAKALMGFGERVDGGMLARAGNKTTEAAWRQLEESNVALRQYRALAADPAALQAQFEQLPEESPARKLGLPYWQAQVATDHADLLDVTKSNYNNPTENTGFMDHQKELVVAMRDVAGLGWGATDMGGESGDVMHFDGRSIGSGPGILKQMMLRESDGSLKSDAPPSPE